MGQVRKRKGDRPVCGGRRGETVRETSEPNEDEEKALQQVQSPPSDEKSEERRDSRLALTMREAEVIAQNLRESGTRR